ncbi:MAG: aminoglycoside phosphotransferase family protein [Verrucomicrobiae bacterium]|nr:aminoglycoside phosphotransferase family protein [Verrucomicrobiae bacterium]
MPTGSSPQWEKLFGVAAHGAQAVRFDWFVLRKHGHPFLFLPAAAPLARHGLTLYPAQTQFARCARALLHIAIRFRLPLPLQRETWIASAENEFLKFAARLVGLDPRSIPTPAVLAGNPAGPGPRAMLLFAGSTGAPKIVVKAGTTPSARELIRAEVNILSQLPTELAGVPRIRASFNSEHVEAFAQEFFPGDSPRGAQPDMLGELLGGWIDTTRTVRVADVPAWQRLAGACGDSNAFKQLAKTLGERAMHPVVWHGDFVPWNIKVNPENGRWTVLDWERAELVGMPGWDWFHYVVQTEILVRKNSGRKLLQAVESLLSAVPFRAYATRAGITGIERPLLAAYLLYHNTIIRPAEGLTPAEGLLGAILEP